MAISKSIRLSFYNFNIEVKCDDQLTLDNVKRDYSFFLADEAIADITFEVFNEEYDYLKLPPCEASFYTPRNICYKQNGISYIDYFGKGLTIINKNNYTVYCTDDHLRHEIVFLSILSLVGQHFDSQNIHRVHSLGLEVNHKAVLILLPSGGGKTTLLLELIKHDFIKFLSEDSPLIDASGRVFPFPIRIGTRHESKPEGIPDEYLHLAQRMEFEPKYLVDINFFKDKIAAKPVEIGYILCGIRHLGPNASIVPLSKYTTIKNLIKDCVVGMGIYQGLEFLFQQNTYQLFKKIGVPFSRLRNSLKISSKAKTYSFNLGYDRAKNLEILLDFLRKMA